MEWIPTANEFHNFTDVAGDLYALDRRLPAAGAWNDLARFRGSSLAVTRWLTRAVAPRAAHVALASWRVDPSVLLAAEQPFFLCLSHEAMRDGLRLLVAEWMEFRRLEPAAEFNLVLRACPPSPSQSAFEFVAPYWEQVQALKGQLGVRYAGLFLWVRAEDDSGDERLLRAARALVVVARGQGFADPFALARRNGKLVVAPHLPNDEMLPTDYPYAFATRPARLRFLGEPRRLDTSAVPWPIPEPLAIAKALQQLVNAPAAAQFAAATRRSTSATPS